MLGCPFPSIYGPARSVAHYSRHWGEIKALKYMEFVRAKCGFSRTVCSLICNRTSKETSNRNAASMGSLGSVSTFFFLETVCFRTASTNELARLLLSRDNSGQAHKKAMIHFRRIGQIISWVMIMSNLMKVIWLRGGMCGYVWPCNVLFGARHVLPFGVLVGFAGKASQTVLAQVHIALLACFAQARWRELRRMRPKQWLTVVICLFLTGWILHFDVANNKLQMF